ncbi:MAG: penicillin-binding protein 2, partial [Rhizobiales bacterium]|nr:penicillin-binding protein 2 [Hyphomicrobiales bacterium]
MSERSVSQAFEAGLKRRVLVVCWLLVVALSALSVRLVWVQVVDHEYYVKQAEGYYLHEETLPPSRGRIYDRNGDLLARSQTVYRLLADANHLRDRDISTLGVAKSEGLTMREVRAKYSKEEIVELYLTEVVRVLATPLGVPNWELRQRFDAKEKGYIVLKRGLPEDDHRALRDLLRESRIGGIYFRQESQRFYPSPDRLTQVMGYVDADANGMAGIEKIADEQLQGEEGFRFLERDRRGREIVVFRGDTKQPREGNHVSLTIDMNLQCIVENTLNEAVELYQPEKATIILMDPATGEILAMASRPHFNLRTREGLLRNPAVGDLYEPGSTFKLIALAGAIDRGLVNLRTPIYCEMGAYEEDGRILHDHHAYPELSAKLVFAKSSNIGIYKIARQLTSARFYNYMRSFGFGQKTGVELTAEARGNVYRVEDWSGTSLSRMAMGY